MLYSRYETIDKLRRVFDTLGSDFLCAKNFKDRATIANTLAKVAMAMEACNQGNESKNK